ncbi:MAG: GLUG motif-containing protein [archaeon]
MDCPPELVGKCKAGAARNITAVECDDDFDCNDNNECTGDACSGNYCVFTNLTGASCAGGVCQNGACVPLCGNGVVDAGEACDGNSIACVSLGQGFAGGTAYCNSSCSGYDNSTCLPRVKGGLYNCADVQNISYNVSGNYVLMQDIDCSETATWDNGAGFAPIMNFNGTLDGNGRSISGLFINRTEANYVGLFGTVNKSEIKNISLVNVRIYGRSGVAGLAGQSIEGVFKNVFVSGNVSSFVSGSVMSYAGLLIGAESNSTIFRCSAEGRLKAAGKRVGGLVGQTEGANSSINECYANVSVTSTYNGESEVGGLVGLVGDFFTKSKINNSYATGNVTGYHRIGGLVGIMLGGNVSNSYSTGRVFNMSASSVIGGLIGGRSCGIGYCTVSNSYWDVQTSEQSSSSGGTGLLTSQMTGTSAQSNMNFDWANVWQITSDYPKLKWQ